MTDGEIFTIPEDDWNEIIRLSTEAVRTPVVTLGLGHKDAATQARERVFAEWLTIGNRLGFDGTEIEPVDEAKRQIRAVPIGGSNELAR